MDDDQNNKEVAEGVRVLRVYLDQRGLSIPRFAESCGLDPGQLARTLSGERGARFTVNFAAAIHDATEGFVNWRLWETGARERLAATRAELKSPTVAGAAAECGAASCAPAKAPRAARASKAA